MTVVAMDVSAEPAESSDEQLVRQLAARADPNSLSRLRLAYGRREPRLKGEAVRLGPAVWAEEGGQVGGGAAEDMVLGVVEVSTVGAGPAAGVHAGSITESIAMYPLGVEHRAG